MPFIRASLVSGIAALAVACAAPCLAAPAAKADLMTPPAGARHYTLSSSAARHGDVWSWTLPDGRIAYRMSMSLRGWVTETDQVTTIGRDGRPTGTAPPSNSFNSSFV